MFFGLTYLLNTIFSSQTFLCIINRGDMGDFAQKVNLPNGRKTKSTKNTSVWTLPFEVTSVHEREWDKFLINISFEKV